MSLCYAVAQLQHWHPRLLPFILGSACTPLPACALRRPTLSITSLSRIFQHCFLQCFPLLALPADISKSPSSRKGRVPTPVVSSHHALFSLFCTDILYPVSIVTSQLYPELSLPSLGIEPQLSEDHTTLRLSTWKLRGCHSPG